MMICFLVSPWWLGKGPVCAGSMNGSPAWARYDAGSMTSPRWPFSPPLAIVSTDMALSKSSLQRRLVVEIVSCSVMAISSG